MIRSIVPLSPLQTKREIRSFENQALRRHIPAPSTAIPVVFRFAESERDVAILDHMLDLSPHCRTHSSQHQRPFPLRLSLSLPHSYTTPTPTKRNIAKNPLTRQTKQYQPINHQDRPKDRHIKHAEPRAQEADGYRPRPGVPELEFRQASDKGPELLVFSRRQAACGAVFHAFILFDRGVEFRL